MCLGMYVVCTYVCTYVLTYIRTYICSQHAYDNIGYVDFSCTYMCTCLLIVYIIKWILSL